MKTDKGLNETFAGGTRKLDQILNRQSPRELKHVRDSQRKINGLWRRQTLGLHNLKNNRSMQGSIKKESMKIKEQWGKEDIINGERIKQGDIQVPLCKQS